MKKKTNFTVDASDNRWTHEATNLMTDEKPFTVINLGREDLEAHLKACQKIAKGLSYRCTYEVSERKAQFEPKKSKSN